MSLQRPARAWRTSANRFPRPRMKRFHVPFKRLKGASQTMGKPWENHGKTIGKPPKCLVYEEKYQQKMDDDWGYPYFRKPPYYGEHKKMPNNGEQWLIMVGKWLDYG